MGLAQKPGLQLYPHPCSLCSSLSAPAPCKLIIPSAALPLLTPNLFPQEALQAVSISEIKDTNVRPPKLSTNEVSAFSLSFGPYITVSQESHRDAWPLLTLTPLWETGQPW